MPMVPILPIPQMPPSLTHATQAPHAAHADHPKLPFLCHPICHAYYARTTRTRKDKKTSYFLETGLDTHAYRYMHRMPLDHMPKLPCHPCSHHSSYSLLKPPPMPTRPIPPVLPTPMPQYILVKHNVKPEDEDESPISLRLCPAVLQNEHPSATGHFRIP